MKRWHKGALVVLGAVVFSSVAIQASDLLRNIDGNLVGLALEGGQSVCGVGAVEVHLATGTLCVDQYEASPIETCPYAVLMDGTQTQVNINERTCTIATVPDAVPWRFVSMQQAQQLCARVGKRLPNNDEWYALVTGMLTQDSCHTDGNNPALTGASDCVTHAGIHDMIGNLWEWVDAEVVGGQYNGRPVPESGYVQLVDADGVVLETGSNANSDYGSDYANTSLDGVYGMIRGGFYDSGEDAGLYAQNLAVPFDLKAPGVGFRCVKSL